MILEIIGGILIFVVMTEIIYFWGFRENYDCFFLEKICSILCSLLTTFFLWGIPFMVVNVKDQYGKTMASSIFYFYWYGAIIIIFLFFGINYWIHKYLEKIELEELKKGSKKKK
jgi:hypothetical protein